MPTKEITSTGVRINRLGTANIDIDDAILSYDIGIAAFTLTPTGSPKATYSMFYPSQALTAGAYTLNLCSGPDGINLDTLYVRYWALWVPAGISNAGAIRFDVGASSGINFAGASTNDITLMPGGFISAYLGSGGPQVLTGSAKNIDVTGTGTDKFGIFVLAGSA